MRIYEKEKIKEELQKQEAKPQDKRPYIAFHNKGDGDNCIYEACKVIETREAEDGFTFTVTHINQRMPFKLENIQYLKWATRKVQRQENPSTWQQPAL